MMKKFKMLFKNIYKTMKRPEMSILPGQLAFFFVLSVVPIITLISYGASFFHVSLDFISNFLSKAFSKDLADLIVPIIQPKTLNIKFFISLIIGFVIASNGADSIIITANAIEKNENRPYIQRRIKAIIMTLFIVTLFVFILLVPVFGTKIIDLFKYMEIDSNISLKIEQVIKLLRGPISWFVMFMFIKIIYTMAPDTRRSSSFTNYGAVFTTVLWIIVTSIYSFYITHFARYDVFYGALANIVILMLWVYLLAYIFVIGMCLNYNHQEEKNGKI